MKKIIISVLTIMVFIFLTGCGKYNENDIVKDFEKKLNKATSYKLSGILEITNNDDTYQYDVTVGYKKNNKYRVSLVNKSNNHEQIILKNSEGVYIITPSLNKSFKFQSDWPNNNSQIYLMHSILNDIKNDSKRLFEEKNKEYIFTTKVKYPNNNELVKQKITIDKNLNVKTVEIFNSNDIMQMIMKFNRIEYNCDFNDNFFDINSIIEEIDIDNEKNKSDEKLKKDSNSEKEEQNESSENDLKNNNQTAGSIDDIIYPLYIPTGTSLTEQEKISTTTGERIILTFEGEKPFLLVEETSSVSEDFDIIPTFGEPYFLTDTIGALTDNSISWSTNGIDYYLVSETMSQVELIEIASSISAIPTIK